jgi:hypothetical protein
VAAVASPRTKKIPRIQGNDIEHFRNPKVPLPGIEVLPFSSSVRRVRTGHKDSRHT